MRFTSRDLQKHFGLDVYAASQLIRPLVRKNIVRLVEKGGRIYEVVDAPASEVPPPELVTLLVKFNSRNTLTRSEMQEVWGLPRHTAYRLARELVQAGWLELTGAKRGSEYQLTDKAKNATV
jgi:CRP-like cAMP-binding protein